MIRLQRVIMLAGAAFLLAAASLLGYSLIDDYRAGMRAEKLLQATLLQAEALGSAPLGSGDAELSASVTDTAAGALTEIPEVIGIVGVPRFSLKLPVYGEFTPEKMDITACRYSGRIGQPPERLIIAGHNFKSHFGQVPELILNDEVLFTTLDGTIYTYAVSELEAITGYDRYGVATGDWDLTLLTCNQDLSMRVLVRCTLVREVVQPSATPLA